MCQEVSIHVTYVTLHKISNFHYQTISSLINGQNLVLFLPIITSRAALLRGALAERRAKREYVRSRVDSVVQNMAELQRQLAL